MRDAGGEQSPGLQKQVRISLRVDYRSVLWSTGVPRSYWLVSEQVVSDAGGEQRPGLQKQIRMVNTMVREEQASASAQSAAGEKGSGVSSKRVSTRTFWQ